MDQSKTLHLVIDLYLIFIIPHKVFIKFGATYIKKCNIMALLKSCTNSFYNNPKTSLSITLESTFSFSVCSAFKPTFY